MSNSVFPISPGRATWNSTRSQNWAVEEATTGSGRRRSIINQNFPEWIFTLNFLALNKIECNSILGFYAQMKGSWDSFWYKDYHHHRITGQILPMVGNKFQCIIVTGNYTENADKVDNLTVYVNGEETTDYTEVNGKITVDASAGEVTADYDYYYKVAFDGEMSITQKFKNVYGVGVKLKVVRE